MITLGLVSKRDALGNQVVHDELTNGRVKVLVKKGQVRAFVFVLSEVLNVILIHNRFSIEGFDCSHYNKSFI